VNAIPNSTFTYHTRVFGHEAITEITELMDAGPLLWGPQSDPHRICEVTGMERESTVSAILQRQPLAIIVIRKNSSDPVHQHETTLKRMAGYMPLECQGMPATLFDLLS